MLGFGGSSRELSQSSGSDKRSRERVNALTAVYLRFKSAKLTVIPDMASVPNERELGIVAKIVDVQDMVQLRDPLHPLLKGSVGVETRIDRLHYLPANALHDERPVRPQGAALADHVGDME